MVGIGFFAPFPLALMVPFMAGQSLAMGEAFGKGFQYGKRKISSMSNEEFNALNFQQLSESIATDYKSMIPSLKKSIEASDELQRAVFQALGALLLSIPDEIKEFFSNVAGSSESAGLPVPTPIPGGAGGGAYATLGIFTLFDFWKWLGITDASQADFTKQYNSSVTAAIKAQDARRLNEIRKNVIRDEAYARWQNRQAVTVTEPFTPSTPNKATHQEIAVLNATLLKLRQRLAKEKFLVKSQQLKFDKQQSLVNALAAAGKLSIVQTRNLSIILKTLKAMKNNVNITENLITKTEKILAASKARL